MLFRPRDEHGRLIRQVRAPDGSEQPPAARRFRSAEELGVTQEVLDLAAARRQPMEWVLMYFMVCQQYGHITPEETRERFRAYKG